MDREDDVKAARAAYLKSLPPEEQVEVLLRAEQVGPGPSDADWLVAKAAHDAVEAYRTSIDGLAQMMMSLEPMVNTVEDGVREGAATGVAEALRTDGPRILSDASATLAKIADERIASIIRQRTWMEMVLPLILLVATIALGWNDRLVPAALDRTYHTAYARGVLDMQKYEARAYLHDPIAFRAQAQKLVKSK